MNYIFVDFDDTLCVHESPIKTEEHLLETVEEACKNFYKKSKANEDIIDYLDYYKKEGSVIIMLSACNSKMIEVKKYWCSINCPGVFDDYIGTSVDLSKTQIIKAYADFYKVKLCDMTLIDDNDNELEEATKAGIATIDSKEWETL